MNKKAESNTVETVERIFVDSEKMSLELMVNLALLVTDIYEKSLVEIPKKSINGKDLLKELNHLGVEEFFTIKSYYGLGKDLKKRSFKEIATFLELRKEQIERRRVSAIKFLRKKSWTYNNYETEESKRRREEREKEREMRLERAKNAPIEIETLGLSTKLFNALYRNGYVTIDDFLTLSPLKVLDLRCIGKKSLEEFCNVKKILLESSGKIEKKSNDNIDMALEEIELKTKTYKALKKAGINTVEDLLNLTVMDLINIEEIGSNTYYDSRLVEVFELREKLNRPIEY